MQQLEQLLDTSDLHRDCILDFLPSRLPYLELERLGAASHSQAEVGRIDYMLHTEVHTVDLASFADGIEAVAQIVGLDEHKVADKDYNVEEFVEFAVAAELAG